MVIANEKIIEQLKKEYPIGTRVKLLKMDDPQAPPVGTEGTVYAVDDAGSLCVNWDNGSGLNVIYGEDTVEKTGSDIKKDLQLPKAVKKKRDLER